MKTCIVHDYFSIRGGGERLALVLANNLHADLYCGYRTLESYDESDFKGKVSSLDIPKYFRNNPMLRLIFLCWSFYRLSKKIRKYDVRIFSGIFSLFSAPAKKDGTLNVYYCHTPPRFLYDKKLYYQEKVPLFLKWPYSILVWIYAKFYHFHISKMDIILTNSVTTQERIDKYLKRKSTVVHPPVDTKIFTWKGQKPYYLSTARLAPLKRVSMIVEAFLKMPTKQLIVASGGEDLEKLKLLAKDAVNIEFRNWVDEGQLQTLIGEAIATIYLPRDEDFGMSPVESMAAGKPVIGVAEGGLRETIINGRTGVLLPKEFKVEDICNAVEEMDANTARSMKAGCIKRASEFEQSIFLSKIEKELDFIH